MLHPRNDRIDYGEQLIPPEGYELSRAIGTTYSLDLETLMVLPVALYYAKVMDGGPDDVRYDMLEAITKASDKITVFYQKGQLKVPSKYHHLMAYWENGIESITMPNHVSSFHAKVWVIRYESKEKPARYRLLVTSRNLTFNRDWDIAFSTEGAVQDTEQPRMKPLLHFLEYLNENGRNRISASFIKDLESVKFDIPPGFDFLRFFPTGIKNKETEKVYTNPLTSGKHSFDELLIVSPFVDRITLESLHAATSKTPYLLSRKEELDSIEPDTLALFDPWQFSRFIQQAEHHESLEEGVEAMEQNLHAKLFVVSRDERPFWYLGSTNCTDPAQCRNVEFMVELRGDRAGTRPRNIFRLLTDGNKSDGVTLFTPYAFEGRVSVDEQKKIALAVRKIKYDLANLEIEGEALQPEGTTVYNLVISINARRLTLPAGFIVKVKPLPENNKNPVVLKPGVENTIVDFTGYPETSLSPFLEFAILKDNLICSRFLLWMNITLPQSRLNRIFTSIIDSREKFMKYLTFLLSGEDSQIINDVRSGQMNNMADGHAVFGVNGAPVYEQLLVAASRFPSKLTAIDKLIERLKGESTDLKEPIITPEFESFWQVFRTYLQEKQNA